MVGSLETSCGQVQHLREDAISIVYDVDWRQIIYRSETISLQNPSTPRDCKTSSTLIATLESLKHLHQSPHIMPKSRASRGILLTSNLPQLQNLIKRDPISYREEFLTQYNHYLSLLRLLQHSPLAFSNDSGSAGDGTIKSSSNSSTSNAQHFRELLTFIAQVAQCYPEETKTFPTELGDLLMEDGKIGGSGGARGIGNDTRKSMVQNLVMLRNKGVISSQK